MAPRHVISDFRAAELLELSRAGDENAFGELVAIHRSELLAHCYRMLGSMHDAEDALQEALIRAWRALPKFNGRSSFRTWIYRIATNTSLDSISSPARRVLPVDQTEPSNPLDGPGMPLIESTWIEPFPDDRIGVGDGFAGPESRYEMRESVELAFVAALQLLPPNQRAVLILRDVLGFSAREVAATLDVTEPAITSALQRARKTLEDRRPEQSQQATMRALGDDRVREIVTAYMEAMQRGDVDAVVGMLTEDAAWSMPPLASWYGGLEQVRQFLQRGPLSGEFSWRHVPVRANGQTAVGCYTWNDDRKAFMPFCIDVLTLDGERLSAVTAFIVKTMDVPDGDFDHWPDEAADPRRLDAVFHGFGLPDHLD
ncbi:MAG: sigma-70 family RNA polymerase sigma factor [Solirubrobacterales bacterium]